MHTRTREVELSLLLQVAAVVVRFTVLGGLSGGCATGAGPRDVGGIDYLCQLLHWSAHLLFAVWHHLDNETNETK